MAFYFHSIDMMTIEQGSRHAQINSSSVSPPDGHLDSQRPSEMKLLQEQLNTSDDATNAAAAAAAWRHGRGFFDEIMEYLDENGRDSANGRYRLALAGRGDLVW